MRNFVKSLEIDVDKEIQERKTELKKIGEDISKKKSMNNEACYDRVYELSELIAENLDIKLDDNFKDELYKRVKIYDSYNPIDFLKNPTKIDKILAVLYGGDTIYNFYVHQYPTILHSSIVFLAIEHTLKVIPHTNLFTNEITILRYKLFGFDGDYAFDDIVSHELTHCFSFKNKHGFKDKLRMTPLRKNLRREEGIAIASEMLTLEKLCNQAGDINYKRQKLLRENEYLSKAKKFEKRLNCYLTRFYPLNEISHRNHGEGFAKMLELMKKYGDSTLPRVFRGEFDNEFK